MHDWFNGANPYILFAAVTTLAAKLQKSIKHSGILNPRALMRGKHGRVIEVKRNFSSASHLTRVSGTLLIRNTLIISSLPAALSECSGQMTSVENIDLNGNACTSLSKSGAPPSVQENNTLFCCSLGKCHYTSCLRPDARRSRSAGC